jgi:hypothetical protein
MPHGLWASRRAECQWPLWQVLCDSWSSRVASTKQAASGPPSRGLRAGARLLYGDSERPRRAMVTVTVAARGRGEAPMLPKEPSSAGRRRRGGPSASGLHWPQRHLADLAAASRPT